MATADLTARLEAAVSRLERVARKMGGGSAGGDEDGAEEPEYIAGWNSLISGELARVLAALAKIKGLENWIDIIRTAFNGTTGIIAACAKCKKPTPAELMGALKPVSDQLGVADSSKYKGKRELKEHVTACFELVQSLQWLVIVPPAGTPFAHCKAQKEAVEFSLNRVIKSRSDADTKEFNLSMRALCTKQVDFVKEFFKTGLEWNPAGVALSEFDSSAAASAAPTKSAAPAAEEKSEASASGGGKKEGDVSAVFGELSKGLAVTGGLKKVKASQKTKNRADRSGKVTMKAKAKKVTRKKGAESTRYVGGRWMVENYNEGTVVMDKAEAKQNVYLAVCDFTTIEVKGKVKAVTVDSCNKCTVYIDEVISTVEIVNCKSTTVVIRQKAPTLSVEKSSSARIILLKDAYECAPSIYTSNVSAMNVEIPGAEAGADPVDIPIPEQFVTKFDPAARTAKTEEVVHG